MAETPSFSNLNEAQDWLARQPSERAKPLVLRMALRAAPALWKRWQWNGKGDEDAVLRLNRRLVTCLVFLLEPAAGLLSLTNRLADANRNEQAIQSVFGQRLNKTADIVHSILSASRSLAGYVTNEDILQNVFKRLVVAIDAAAISYDEMLDALSSDAMVLDKMRDVLAQPLSLNGRINRDWNDAKDLFETGGGEWSFWMRWYEAILAGRSFDPTVLQRVAQIPDEVWDQGADAVAAEIARIELEYAVEASPNAEDIIINDAGLYEVVPRSKLPARTLQDARDRIADTIRLIRGAEAQNQYGPLLAEADLLDDTLDRYGDNALRLHEVCFKVVRHVGTHVANGVLPEADNLVGDVTGDLQNAADDIYNFDDEVRRTVDARAKLRFGRLDEAQKKQVEELALAIAERSVPALAEELREDTAVVLAEGKPVADGADSRYRLGSRLARVVALGGRPLKNVAEALVLVGGVGGGLLLFSNIVIFLLGLLL